MSDDETTQTETTEQTETRDTMPGPLAAKIAQAMGQIQSVPKNGQVNFGNTNYDYATADDIMSAAKDAMAAAGLAIIPSVVDEDWNSNGNNVYLTIEYTIIDGESGETWTSRWRTQGNDSGDKAYWKALTQGKKYFLRDVFCIPTGETHLDAEADSPETDHTPNDGGQQRRAQRQPQRSRQTPRQGNGQTSQSSPDVDHNTQTKRLHALLGEVELSDQKGGELRDVIRLKSCGSVDAEWDDVPAQTIARWCDRLEQLGTDAQSSGPPERVQKILDVVDGHDVNRDAAAE
jgi:hypothetical protein